MPNRCIIYYLSIKYTIGRCHPEDRMEAFRVTAILDVSEYRYILHYKDNDVLT